MDKYLEIALSFFTGAAILGLLAFIFSLKTKGIFRLIINTLAGCVMLLLFSFFKILPLAVNPLNALIVAILGIPGFIVIAVLTFI